MSQNTSQNSNGRQAKLEPSRFAFTTSTASTVHHVRTVATTRQSGSVKVRYTPREPSPTDADERTT